MKKSRAVIIAVIVVLVVVAGFALLHKSSKPAANTTTSNVNTTSVTNAILTTKTDPKLGKYLTNSSGMTLYTYNGDTSGVSNCSGSCLASWPAYQVSSSSTSLPAGVGTIKRTDNGEAQYTYNRMPLYTFVGDSQGRVTGNGVDNFRVATPAVSSTTSTTKTTSSSPYNY